MLEPSNKLFLPVDKRNKDFARAPNWKIMILKIKVSEKTKWYHLKSNELYNLVV